MICMDIVKRVAVMRRERTEMLKAKRRLYGDTGGHLHFSEQVFVPRPDDISNAITTFEKDNYVYIEYGSDMKYNKDNPLRVVTLCSGYDSQCLALERLKECYPEFDYELVAWAEWDPQSKQPMERQPAVRAHNALFPQWADRNLGDMTKIDWSGVGEFDFLFYSTPCQSISAAGLQHGFAEGSGTRSSIIWNVRDAVKAKRPKFLCLENVKAMVSKKFLPMFNLWQDELSRLGYTNFAQVLNAKHYGVPQNRERIFLVSVRNDALPELADGMYHFPAPFPLERRLKDVLEDKVDERYYLSDKMLDYFQRVNEDTSHGHKFRPKDGGQVGGVVKANPACNADDNFVIE